MSQAALNPVVVRLLGPRALGYAAQRVVRDRRGLGESVTTTTSATGGTASQTFSPIINVGEGAGAVGGKPINPVPIVIGGLAAAVALGALVLLGGGRKTNPRRRNTYRTPSRRAKGARYFVSGRRVA